MSRYRTIGFTLVELLVVVAIIALLIAMLLPSLDKARHSARMIAEQTQIRQMLIGMHQYADENNGRLCKGYDYYNNVTWNNKNYQGKWVYWNSEPLIGRFIGNKAISCSSIWPLPNLVSEIIYCPELTRAQKTFKQYKDMPWHSGLAMNNAPNTPIAFYNLKRTASFGLITCAGKKDGDDPDSPVSLWNYITYHLGDQNLDKNYNNRTGGNHNAYRHLNNTNIGFADGHTAATTNAVDDQRAGLLQLWP